MISFVYSVPVVFAFYLIFLSIFQFVCLIHCTLFHCLPSSSNERMYVLKLNKILQTIDKNLAIANRSRVSFAHNTLRASIGINITS